MSVPNYTYFATIGAVETQVYPSGDWSLKITKAEEDFPFCKDYRTKFEGDFIFSGDDYDLIRAAGCCDKIDLKIQCDGLDYWFGYFAYPYDLKVDEDRCTITGTPKPLDKYYYFDLYADYKREELGRGNQVTWQRNFPTVDPVDVIWEGNVNDCVPCEAIVDIIDNRFLNTPLVPGGFTLNLKSAFFNDSADGFPSGPYTPGAGNNYVTGCPNKLDHVVMVMAADVWDVAAGAPWSPGAEMSFNEFMEVVHNTFNTWWYIDENGDFRIEHIYFWELYFPTSYDLTTIDGGRWIVNTSKYDYRVEEIPKEEQWNWNDEWMDTFIEEKFTYYLCFLPGKTRYIKEYSLSDLTTDIEYIAQGVNNLATSPPAVPPDSAYMFLRCILDTEVPVVAPPEGPWPAVPACADYVVWFSRYLIDGNDHLNAHLSPTNLLANYWMHDRPLWTGYMTELAEIVNFESTWKNLRQMEFCFPVCCEECFVILSSVAGDPKILYQFGIDFNEPIVTQYLAGELYTGTIKDGMLCLQLIFEDIDCEESATEWSGACEL